MRKGEINGMVPIGGLAMLRSVMEFSGIDMHHPECADWVPEDANGVSFVLDGNTFFCIEEKEDDYRSLSSQLYFLEGVHVKNVFYGVRVFVSGVMDLSLGRDLFLIKLKACFNKNTVLTVGTVDFDDYYYPCFIRDFEPKNLHNPIHEIGFQGGCSP